jgi:hypothetical protein
MNKTDLKTVATTKRLSVTITFCLLVLTSAISVYAAKHQVNCDVPGQSLTKAFEAFKPGDSILVHGVCRERLTITAGPLTFEGDGTWVMDGTGLTPNDTEFNGIITIDGAQGITIRGVTIRNGSGEGILGTHGANIVVQNARIEHTGTGIGLSNSSAEVTDSTFRHNAIGIDAYSASTVIFRGEVDISQNLGGESLTLNGSSLAEIRGGHLQVNNNAIGIIISANSTLAIFGFQASQGSRLTTSGNQGPGIVIGRGHLFVAGSTLAPGGIVVTSSGNGGPGVLVTENASITSPFGAAKFVIENNPVGMQFQQGSSGTIVGGLTVRNNGVAGIQADNASGLTFVSIPTNPSTIQSNGTDVILKFGTKSTIDGVAVGTMVCDVTVLSRGTKVCP